MRIKRIIPLRMAIANTTSCLDNQRKKRNTSRGAKRIELNTIIYKSIIYG